jgi:Tellurite resistance protein and related permeases
MSIKKFFKHLPLPICGLILALVSLGNLLVSFNQNTLGEVYCSIGLFIMLLVLAKLLFTFPHALQSLQDPIIASVAPTFTMAWMVLCVFLQRLLPGAQWIRYVWLAVVCLHFALMVYFVMRHMSSRITMQMIYPSWFITFVGIGVIPNTSIGFFPAIGPWVLWLALALYFLLLPIILIRGLQAKQMPEGTLPLLTIIAAPGSLCLAGYLAVGILVNQTFITFLWILSQSLYVIILIVLVRLVRVPFYPSYAAFTFPLVISATAMNKVLALRSATTSLQLLGRLEILLALLMVTYVLIRYVLYLATFNQKNS